MKKIYYILLTFFIISLASCNFFFGGQLIEEDDTKIFEYDYEDEWYDFGDEEKHDYQAIGEFWDKLDKYKEKHDVYLKGN